MQEKAVKRNTVVALIVAILMTTSMFPLVVFADTPLTISSPKAANSTIYTGDAFSLSVSSPDFSNSTTNHIDWTSSDTSVATIGKHNGNVAVLNAGSVTFTATAMDGAKPSGNGSGGGSGSNCTASSGYETATISFTVAQSTTYGYQGTGGNTMLLTALNGTAVSASNVLAGSLINGTGFDNTIISPTATAGTVSFGFMMSAGTNSFNYSSFNDNCVGEISIFKNVNGTWSSYCGIADLTSTSFDSTTHVITIYTDDDLPAGKYKITFGTNVCGNNPSKKLGVPISFVFDVVSAN